MCENSPETSDCRNDVPATQRDGNTFLRLMGEGALIGKSFRSESQDLSFHTGSAECVSAGAKRSLPPHLVQMLPRGSFEAFAARIANDRTLIGRSFDQPPARPPEPPRRLPVFLRKRPTTPLTLLRSDGFRFS